MDDATRKELNAAGAASQAHTEQILGGKASRSMYFDRQGRPIGMGDWSMLFHDLEYRVVGSTMVHGARVSTVWLGLDHGFLRDRPVIFETMAFDETETRRSELLRSGFHPSWDAFSRRYCTEAEAVWGHGQVVEEVRQLFRDALRNP